MLKLINHIHPRCLITWCRRLRAYGHARKQSDYRATSMAQKLVLSGALQNSRLTGSPLAREPRP